MQVVFKKTFGWEDALDAARTTRNKSILQKEPSEVFKRRVLAAEHSPIREVLYRIRIDNVPKWVTTHIVRHKFEKFVGTQRTDITGSPIPRDKHPQGEPTAIFIDANAQSLIDVSPKRLCHRASPETQTYWRMVLSAIKELDPVVVEYCVPTCVYRGVCPEAETCGYYKTEAFKARRAAYVKLIENSRDGLQPSL